MRLRKYLGGGVGGRHGSGGGFGSGMNPHAIGGAYHVADTITNVNTKLTDGSLITTKANEIAVLPPKAVPTMNDFLVIEDAADANNKKSVTISQLQDELWTPRYYHAPGPASAGNFNQLVCGVGGADLPINSVATSAADGINVSIFCVGYGSGFNSACYFAFQIPGLVTNIHLGLLHKPQGATGMPVLNVRLDIYGRSMSMVTGLFSAWSAIDTHIVAVPITQTWKYDTLIIPLATLNLVPGTVLGQIALYRNGPAAEDTLGLNWSLQYVKLFFS